MKLHHWSERRIDTLYDVEIQPYAIKPVGLWVSVDNEWDDWCKSEGFRDHKGWHKYEVDLCDADVLLLNTPERVLEFNEQLKSEGSMVEGFSTIMAAWQSIADKCDGLIIAPYLWQLRLDRRCSWYYGWDIAGGCIWNASKLKIKKVT